MCRQTSDDNEGPHPFDVPHLLEEELASRWRISLRTLQRRRLAGCAPAHLPIGRRVLYPREEVEQYEARRLERVEAEERRVPSHVVDRSGTGE